MTEQGIRPGYKQTEAGVIPEDWEAAALSQLCRLVNGRGFKPREWRREGYPIIRIQNLNGSDDFNYFSGKFDPKILVESNQLLFAWSGSRGTSFGPHVWRGQAAVLNYHTWKIVTTEKKVDSDFFFHALRNLTKSIEDAAHGASALVHTQKREMENYLIPIPRELAEQRAIAQALADADGVIAGLEAVILKKRDLKQAAMQHLLTGKTRLPGFSGEWELKRLGDLLTVRHGKSQKTVESIGGRYPILATGGEIGRTDAYLYDKPSVLIGRKGTIDDPQYVDSPFWTIDTLFYTEISARAVPQFIYYKFLMIDWRSYNEASGVPSLSSKTIEKIEIACPHLGEQTAIAEVLSDMDGDLAALGARLAKACAVKQGMMQQLLTGKVRLI